MLRRFVAACFIVAAVVGASTGPAGAQCAGAAVGCLTAADVLNALQSAATAISPSSVVVVVVDRAGVPLGIYEGPTAAGTFAVGNFGNLLPAREVAAGLARTGAFFSNDQAPLSSRTVRFISGIHFPPGVTNKPPAALYGIENTNRGCALNPVLDAVIPRATSTAGGACTGGSTAGCGSGIVTGKADVFDSDPSAANGGGVPIFKDGRVAGGVGVAGVPLDAAEFAAFMGSIGGGPRFGPRPAAPGTIFLDGIQLPFVNNTIRPAGIGAGVFVAAGVVLGPIPSAFASGVPSGYLVGPNGDGQISASEVDGIVANAVAQASRTRAAIRLPLGSSTRMVIAVAGLDGTLLAVFRMPDATIFSIDVAGTKARNVVYFSSTRRHPDDMPGFPLGFSMTARTIGFGAMPLYPAGIDGTSPGPFFEDFRRDVLNVCTQARDTLNLTNQSGIVFFPGSIGLYRGGTLVGGLGVSGDGVEQDDLVTAAGVTPNFVAPPSIRADRVLIGGVRLPFFKFPRNPEIQ